MQRLTKHGACAIAAVNALLLRLPEYGHFLSCVDDICVGDGNHETQIQGRSDVGAEVIMRCRMAWSGTRAEEIDLLEIEGNFSCKTSSHPQWNMMSFRFEYSRTEGLRLLSIGAA